MTTVNSKPERPSEAVNTTGARPKVSVLTNDPLGALPMPPKVPQPGSNEANSRSHISGVDISGVSLTTASDQSDVARSDLTIKLNKTVFIVNLIIYNSCTICKVIINGKWITPNLILTYLLV